jgi:phosphate-selective porin OprO/OprP
MNKTPTGLIAAKRLAVAVATVCATLAVPAYATDDVKNVLDLMLKKGVISQQDYDQFMKDNADAAENKQFKEKRLDQDVAKANAYLIKNAEAGQVMKNGIGIQSADGQNSIQLTGRLHMDYRQYSPSWAPGASPDKDPFTDVLEVRRARLGVRGQFQKDWKYEIVGNYGMSNNGMSSSATEVDVAFVDYAAKPEFQVRMGKFKMPFSLEQLTSSNNIDFMERSLANQNEGEFVPGKETGVMAFGSPSAGITYGLALSVGRGNKSPTIDSLDTIGRVTANLSKAFANNDSIVTHVGLAYSSGKIKTITPSMGRTETRWYTSTAADVPFIASSSITDPDRTRLGYEFAVAYEALKVQGEIFDFKYKKDIRTDEINTNYLQVVYNLTGEKHNYSNSAGTFGWIKPNQPFSLEKGGLGAWQVGVRFSSLDASDVKVATGKTNELSAWTYGLTWFVNDNARVMLNYTSTDFNGVAVGTRADQRITKESAVMLRGQLSF